MRITIRQLRRIIRETLDEEGWPPGRWYPGDGEPVDPEEVELMTTAGLGRKKRKADLDEEDLNQ